MPKKTTQNDYLTRQELQLALKPYATKLDLVNIKDEILGEVRSMFDEVIKAMQDNSVLITNDLNATKLVQVQHTRQIDQNTLDIEDLQQDVGMLQTLNTI